MPRILTKALLAIVTAGLVLSGAPAASAQSAPGSVAAPIIVPRPFDIQIWQLPPLPYPFEWEFHLPPAPPRPAPAPAPQPVPLPREGDTCPQSRIGELSPNKLRCTFMGTQAPARWVRYVESAINPDGTIKPGMAG